MATGRPTRFKWQHRGSVTYSTLLYMHSNLNFWVTFGADSAANVLTSFDELMFCDAVNMF